MGVYQNGTYSIIANVKKKIHGIKEETKIFVFVWELWWVFSAIFPPPSSNILNMFYPSVYTTKRSAILYLLFLICKLTLL